MPRLPFLVVALAASLGGATEPARAGQSNVRDCGVRPGGTTLVADAGGNALDIQRSHGVVVAGPPQR